jgi:hypothetical protein
MHNNVEWEINVKWEIFFEEHKIKIYELPEKIQKKIENFEDIYDKHDEIQDTKENESAIRKLELTLITMDKGILSDLQTFVATQKLKTQIYLN